MHEKQQNTLLKTFYLIYNVLTDATVCVKKNSVPRGVERQGRLLTIWWEERIA